MTHLTHLTHHVAGGGGDVAIGPPPQPHNHNVKGGMALDSPLHHTATTPTISEVRFRFAPGSNGLLGYASVRLGDHLLNDIGIIRAADGNVICCYPRRFSASGHPHYIHQPISRAMADALQEAIVGRLRGLLDGSQPVKEEETT